METVKRSLIKSATWRVLGSSATLLVSYFITGSFALAGTIALVGIIVNTVLYYVHERVWNKFR